MDESNVYWIASGLLNRKDETLGKGSVVKLPKAGGTPTTLASGEDLISSIAIDTENVFWASLRGVFKVPKSGGATTQLHHAEDGAGLHSILATSPPVIYVGVTHMKDGGLYAITRNSNGARPLTIGFFGVHAIAVDSGGVYMCVGPSGTALGYSPTGGEDQILAKGLGDCNGLAHEGGRLFWTETRTRLIQTMPDSGGRPTTLAAEQGEPWAIAARGDWIYWTDRGHGAIRRVRSDGGEVETMASGPWKPQGLAVDADAVYWTAPEEGSIYKLALSVDTVGQSAPEVVAVAASATPSTTATPADARSASGGNVCTPCSTQEDFDLAMKSGSKCCPVLACKADADCTGGRVCCKIPGGQLCGDPSRCTGSNRVER